MGVDTMENRSKYTAQMRYAAKAVVKVYFDLYRKTDTDIARNRGNG